MKNLKIVLWILAAVFLLGFVQMVLPMKYLNAIAEPFGFNLTTANATVNYMARVTMGCLVLLGILLIMMALDPKKHLRMVKVVGWALLALGVYMLILISVVYKFENYWYYADPIWCLVFGGFVLGMTRKMK